MRILMIGGTQFVGRAMAEEALARGHDVTLFHRGVSAPAGLDGTTSIHGDRDVDLSGLANGRWDATIDVCAYRPGQVDALAAALETRGGRHVFISTVSVYADDIAPNSDEDAPLASLAPIDGHDHATCDIDGATYGPLKVVCEQRVSAHYDNPVMIRPTYVFGPRDNTMRFPTWVQHFADGGIVDVPLPRDSSMQYIDSRDLASFTIDLIERDVTGTFHTAAPPTTFGAMVDDVAAAIGADDLQLNWVVADAALAETGEYPLWAGPEPAGQLQVDPAAAIAAGLTFRPLAQTARDTLEWVRTL